MKIFKESKYQPIKFRGFKFIGFHKDYPNACYYYKPLERNNYELMECMLEGEKKPEIGAGTTVKVLDTFMSKYLELLIDEHPKKEEELVITAINSVFSDFEVDVRKSMKEKFNVEIAGVKLGLVSEEGKEYVDSHDASNQNKKIQQPCFLVDY